MAELTNNLNNERPFEERVFARFDAIDSAIRGLSTHVESLDTRVERLEIRSYDTKPIWERALKAIEETQRGLSETRQELADTRQELRGEIAEVRAELTELRREFVETRRVLSKQLDRIGAIVHENRADIREAEKRIERLENRPA